MTDRPIICSNVQWYVAVAQPGMDKRVAADLAGQGFDVHLAVHHERMRKSNRAWIELTGYPLSPYVFVGLDQSEPKHTIRAVKDTLGVEGVISLTMDGSPNEVPPKIIRFLRACELAELDSASRRVRARNQDSIFKLQDEVEVMAGHILGGMRGKVTKLCNGGAEVDLNAPGFTLPARFDDDDLIPAARSRKVA